ncbi:MAG: aminotransferase class I/II-fold pyridoxal phosphate-dependent enzyme [Polyangiaceae bacterium]|nr:aminotransferase class I/II-fold pyridoxal phosphate-dependent enzyme [Polyangiaceae bacterium]MCW5790785.1 aminotransferase class I/II-fold pyridoxal phosphate-dependent enzyme [Polyangiaceae bacterium]
MSLIDLRSDTVTRPTPGMRQAMSQAEVGDDVYGEDPSVRALEEDVAARLGKAAALFVPSGTMGNQLALMSQTRRGDEVVVGRQAHLAWYESGAGAALSGVQFVVAGDRGWFDAGELTQAIKPVAYHLPRTSLVALENTHNASGGRVFPRAAVEAVAETARKHGLALHLDGARLWHAAAATGLSPSALCEPFDTVSVCFSKGLGAPVGSALVGPTDLIVACRRLRKMLGGGMRQAGILAVAASYALRHHLERLAEDHERARSLAEVLASAPGVRLDPSCVETNIVVFELAHEGAASERDGTASERAARFVRLARERGVLVSQLSATQLRVVTHLDVSAEQVTRAGQILSDALREVAT